MDDLQGKISNLVTELKGALSPDAFERFQANIKTGEWKSAFEDLGDVIKREGVELSDNAKDLLEKIKGALGLS
jgi:hypothetical protein